VLLRSDRTSITEDLDHGTKGEGIKAPFDLDGKVLADMDANPGWTPCRSAGDHFQEAMWGCWVFTESATPEIKTAWGNMGLPAISQGALTARRLLIYDVPPMGAPFRHLHMPPPDHENRTSSKGLSQRLDQVKMSPSDGYLAVTKSP